METLASQKSILILDKDNRILSVVDDIMQLRRHVCKTLDISLFASSVNYMMAS